MDVTTAADGAPPPTATASMADAAFDQHETVRVAVLGLGARGRSLTRNLLNIDGARISAIFDPRGEAVRQALELIADAGVRPPAAYSDGEERDALARDDIDLVIIATPWPTHARLACAAMHAGKHVAVEVPAAVTLQDCWDLVDASERCRRHCLILENCCYGDEELLVLNLVKAGALGQLLHGEAAYIHEMRQSLVTIKDWRRQAHIERNGNLYPTHGLGPVAMCMGINRGDRLATMVSLSSPSRGLQRWRDRHLAANDPRRAEIYQCGDINTSIIKTAVGRTILLQHQVVNPRPYDRLNVIVGTRGVFAGFPARIYLDDQAGPEEYTGLDGYRDQYEHDLWREQREQALRSGGHGGMDYIMLGRVVDAMRRGAAPDLDVYDAAAWSAPGPLSEASVAANGAPVDIPDFTRGGWTKSRPIIE